MRTNDELSAAILDDDKIFTQILKGKIERLAEKGVRTFLDCKINPTISKKNL